MSEISGCQLSRARIDRIDTAATLTDFSLGPPPLSLADSIRRVGVTHPVALADNDGFRGIVCGHRRVRVAKELGLPEIPAYWLPARLEDEEMLALNLFENGAHREYSDIEKAAIVRKFAATGAGDDKIIRQYMPILGFERSKKIYLDLLETKKFDAAGLLKTLLHEANLPLRVFATLFRWEAASLETAGEFFSLLRPGVNKWREILELVDEIAGRDGITPGFILGGADMQAVSRNPDFPAHVRCEKILAMLRRRRYPTLDTLRRQVWLALDKLRLDDDIKIRFPENFENGEIRIEMKFDNAERLWEQARRLAEVARTEAMRDLTRVFRDLGKG